MSISTRLRLRTSVIFVIVCAFCFTSTTAGCGEHSQKVVKTREGIIEFSLANENFRIPAMYFKGAYQSHLGVMEGAHLWALLPDFEGYDENKNKREFTEVRGWGRRIYIDLKVRGATATTQEFVDGAFVLRKPLQPALREGKYDTKEHGLEIFHHYQKSTDLYVHREDGAAKLILRCYREGSVSAPGCNGFWDYSKEVVVKVSFNKKYLAQWQDIVTKTNALLINRINTVD